nr:MAG TPA: hypothetical protein [Caudoviricetes sp.]
METKLNITREVLSSVAGGVALRYIDLDKPSQIIPFKGEFPMLNSIDSKEFRRLIKETMTLMELPELYQQIAVECLRISAIEDGFKEYLQNRAISVDEFLKLNNSDKADYLFDYMNSNSISYESLKININYGKNYVR